MQYVVCAEMVRVVEPFGMPQEFWGTLTVWRDEPFSVMLQDEETPVALQEMSELLFFATRAGEAPIERFGFEQPLPVIVTALPQATAGLTLEAPTVTAYEPAVTYVCWYVVADVAWRI